MVWSQRGDKWASEMEQSRILISCTGRTLVLAEKLRDALRTESRDVALWSDDGRSQSSAAILEMLEASAEQFHFAAIILVKDDVTATETDDTLRLRDTCAFQAGLFMATMGRKRCFLVSSIDQNILPSHLGGMTSASFLEPEDLSNSDECAKAMVSVAVDLTIKMELQEFSPYYVRVPTLSVAALWRRERHRSVGGELQQGEVVVCDTQPLAQEELAVQVRRNMDYRISYTYFLHFSVDTIEKFCQSLQVILVAGVTGSEQVTDYKARMNIVMQRKDCVLEDLQDICRNGKLRVILLAQEPQFCFRIHNASNRELASVYARYRDQCFINWLQGAHAETLWRTLPRYIESDGPGLLFGRLQEPLDLDASQRRLLDTSLDRGLARYFPGFEREVKQLCTQSTT
jgi:hypothetical protein